MFLCANILRFSFGEGRVISMNIKLLKRKSRCMAAFVCALVFICASLAHSTQVSAEDTLAGLQQQYSNISDRINQIAEDKKKIQQSINNAKSELEKERATKNYLDQQIMYTKEEIQLVEEQIAVLDSELFIKQNEIDDKQADHENNYQLFRQRLRAMYMYDDATTLGILLGTQSFSDFLTKADTVSRVAEHDRNLMAKLDMEKKELEVQRADLEERKDVQQALKVQAEEKKSTLTQQVNAAAARIEDISELEAQFTQDLAEAQAKQQAMQAELNAVLQKIEWSKNPYIGGVMRWPVDNFTQISSDYGWRFANTDYHTGIDITGPGVYNQPVRAANAGTVKIANWSYVPGRGYGIYVLIDHGGTISTLYGHLCNITVNVGDVVEQGQQIGNVGSTGWSTGPHLHFEVRVNGSHTNPMPYLKG